MHWGYKCNVHLGVCEKHELSNDKSATSLSTCRVFCGDVPGTLWPKINGDSKIVLRMAKISPTDIQFNLINQTKRNDGFWLANEDRLREQIALKVPTTVKLSNDGNRLIIMLTIGDEFAKLGLDTNEHYFIEAYENTGVVIVKIRAETIYGGRHALETLSQLIVYDDIQKQLQIVAEFQIDDQPVYSHRGFLLDTSRNYFSIDSIKRTIGKQIISFTYYIHLNILK